MSIHEKYQNLYPELVKLAESHGVYLIVPMMYVVDRETGETTSAQILGEKRRRPTLAEALRKAEE